MSNLVAHACRKSFRLFKKKNCLVWGTISQRFIYSPSPPSTKAIYWLLFLYCQSHGDLSLANRRWGGDISNQNSFFCGQMLTCCNHLDNDFLGSASPQKGSPFSLCPIGIKFLFSVCWIAFLLKSWSHWWQWTQKGGFLLEKAEQKTAFHLQLWPFYLLSCS